MASAARLRFGDCEFDEQTGELSTNGNSCILPSQPFRILVFLLHRPGNLVTRDELAHELWPEGTFADSEQSLEAGVRRLREAIGDSAATPRFIETVPQRGYRFIAPVAASAGLSDDEWLSSLSSVVRHPPALRSANRLAPFLVALLALLLASHGAGPRRPVPESASGRRLVRLTSASGLNTDPALSADGTFLAYASDRDGSFDIYLQRVEGGEPLQLTSGEADDSEPSFAPDGARIVFSRRGEGLYVVGALGGEPRLIVHTQWPRTPRFSPDGRFIAYWTGFPASVVAGGVPGALGSIFVVPSDGGPAREIVTHLASARYPVWSPAGEQLLFLGEEDADRKIHDWYVVPATGGAAVKTGAVAALRAAGLDAFLPIPGTWTARNHSVVFATNETDASNLWQIRVSPSTKQVDGAPERLTWGSAVERAPAVSDSGRTVFSGLVENVDIWRVPLDPDTGLAAGPLERVTDDLASDRLRGVSADGERMFFISSRTKRDEVWVRDLLSGRERQLTRTGVIEASVSHDGSTVAFSTKEGGRSRIEILNTSDGVVSKLCDDCDAPGGWSSDSRQLLYRGGLPGRLLLYDFASARSTELLAQCPTPRSRCSPWNIERPRFAPDARSVTFHVAKSPNMRQVYSARLTGDGAAPRRSWVPVVMDHGCHPGWSSNGSLLYHFSFRDGAFCPWVQSVNSSTGEPLGAPRAVVHLHDPRLRAASGAAAFNDVQAGYLYMTLTEATGNIWMIDAKSR